MILTLYIVSLSFFNTMYIKFHPDSSQSSVKMILTYFTFWPSVKYKVTEGMTWLKSTALQNKHGRYERTGKKEVCAYGLAFCHTQCLATEEHNWYYSGNIDPCYLHGSISSNQIINRFKLHATKHSTWLVLLETKEQTITRRANAQRSIFVILTGLLHQSQSSSLNNQPSWTFELIRTTLPQNDYTSSNFPVTLWSWVNIKVVQIGIKLYSVVVSSITQVWNKLVHKSPDTWWC